MQYGMQFSSRDTVVLPASTLGGFDRTVITTKAISGNEAMARFVYNHSQYAPILSPEDVAQMTWDRSRFWDNTENNSTRTIQPFDNSFNEMAAAQARAMHDQFTARATAMAEALARVAAPAIAAGRFISSYQPSLGFSVCTGPICTDLFSGQAYFTPVPQAGISVDFRYGPESQVLPVEFYFPYRNVGLGVDTAGGVNAHIGIGRGLFESGVSVPIL